MFRKAYRLPFNLVGIPLYLDVSFLFVLPLMVWLTARSLGDLVQDPRLGLHLAPGTFNGWPSLVLGLVSVLGLFTCIVLHELGHSLTARRYGVNVRRITLWFLGGVAEFEEMPRQRGAEAVVAIAGPIVSFALAAVFYGLGKMVPHSWPGLWIVMLYLWAINMMLAIFNLIPAMPLDGGRILRSLLALVMPHPRATLVAGTVAKTIAILLGLWGLANVFLLHQPGGVWTMVLAFFIFTAASRETEHSVVAEILRGIRVTDLMNREVVTVSAGLTVGELGHYIILHHHKGFPVVDDVGRLIGTVGVEQMQSVSPTTPVWQVMSTQMVSVSPTASALDAFVRMSAGGVGRLLVIDSQGSMIGIITRADLMRAIEVRMMGLPIGQAWTPASAPLHRPPYAYTPPPGYGIPAGYAPPAAGPIPPPPGQPAPASEHESSGQPGYTAPPNETGNSERYARPL